MFKLLEVVVVHFWLRCCDFFIPLHLFLIGLVNVSKYTLLLHGLNTAKYRIRTQSGQYLLLSPQLISSVFITRNYQLLPVLRFRLSKIEVQMFRLTIIHTQVPFTNTFLHTDTGHRVEIFKRFLFLQLQKLVSSEYWVSNMAWRKQQSAIRGLGIGWLTTYMVLEQSERGWRENAVVQHAAIVYCMIVNRSPDKLSPWNTLFILYLF